MIDNYMIAFLGISGIVFYIGISLLFKSLGVNELEETEEGLSVQQQ